jgi:hypothetical protein
VTHTPINNSESNPNTQQRRTGGSDNDPHGGHESPDNEFETPNPDKSQDPSRIPPAGPHANQSLTDDTKTPGTGALPDPNTKEIDPGVG